MPFNFSNINIGASPNDGTGDPLRTAFQKTNDNFDTMSSNVANAEIYVVSITSSYESVFNLARATTLQSNNYVSIPKNSLSSNLSASTTISFASDSTTNEIHAYSVGTNVTVSYSDITAGTKRTYILKNYPDSTVRQITLPNEFNNKGSATALISANSSIMLQFIPVDTTSSNVYVNITNN